MTNGNDNAYPQHPDLACQLGLTKLEYFAAMAMRGVLSCSHQNQSATYESVAIESLNYAKALINELNKQQ